MRVRQVFLFVHFYVPDNFGNLSKISNTSPCSIATVKTISQRFNKFMKRNDKSIVVEKIMEDIKMLAYGFGIKEKGLFEIENTLEALQEFVDGYIEVFYIGNDLLVVCNEEGKLRGLDITAALVDENNEIIELIAGNCLVVRDNGEGDFESLRDGDEEFIKRHLKAVIAVRAGIVVIDKQE